MYSDRSDAAAALVAPLEHRRGEGTLVLGVPRGGVPIAARLARSLDAELDVAVARKLGAPGNPELAVGAVAADGEPLLDGRLVAMLRIDADYLAAEAARQAEEVRRRAAAYRGDRLEPDVAGRTVIVVDDGLATGSTMLAVVRWLRRSGAALVVVAVPVGSAQAVARLAAEADEVVCPLVPPRFMAVGEWYRDFRQVDDAEVVAALESAAP